MSWNSSSLVEDMLSETATSANDQPDANTDDTVELSGSDIDSLLGDDTEDTIDVEDIGLDEQEAISVMADAMNLCEQMNIVRLNKQSKLLNLTNRSALVMAKRNNDPLFAKYAKFNKIRRDLRDQIVKKYGSKAASYARKVMNKSAAGQTTPK